MKDKNQILKSTLVAINATESAYGKVVAMIPSIKAAKITRDEFSEFLKKSWGFADMKKKSKEYNNTKQKVSKWTATIFGPVDPKKKPKFVVSTKMTNAFIQWLISQNVAVKDIKKTAVALAANIEVK